MVGQNREPASHQDEDAKQIDEMIDAEPKGNITGRGFYNDRWIRHSIRFVAEVDSLPAGEGTFLLCSHYATSLQCTG